MKQVIAHPESDCVFVGEWADSMANDGAHLADPTLMSAGQQIATTTGVSTVIPSFDFETYSEAGFTIDPITGKVKGTGPGGKGGLLVVGTPVYAEHPSCEILSLWYDLKDGKGRRHWVPGTPNPTDLLDYIAAGGPIEAWNIPFEFYIWNFVGVRKLGWPPLQLEQCFCAMAKSRRYSMPGALGNAAKALGTADKLSGGKNLIQKLTRPHTPTKKRPAVRWTPATAWDDFVAFYDYNGQDVAAEDHAAALLPDLTPYELPIYRVDQVINVRGVYVDTQTLDAALDILGQTECKYTMRLAEVTGGAVGSVSEVAKIVTWLGSVGVHIPDATADTVSDTLKRTDLPPAAREVLEIREALGSANVKKLRSLKMQVSSDGRLRNQYMYCGADRTGRWSAGGVQLQNITSKGPATAQCADCDQYFGQHHIAFGCPRCGAPDWAVSVAPDWTVECVEQAIADIRTGHLGHVEMMWGTVIATLCGCLRGLFTARPGTKFVCVDFSAIEAVVAACVSRCQWRIDVFSTHGKIYEMSAAKITGTSLEVYDEYKKANGFAHPDRKKIGKVAELASGYGGWIGAWKNFGADMPDDEIKAQILAWREASPEIVEMWGGEYKWAGPGKWDYKHELHGLEGCAMQAIMYPGYEFKHTDIGYFVADDILFCRLPSGRFLHYHSPRLVPTEDKLRRGPAHSITFMGYNSNATKGPVGWMRQETYGGRLFENVVQAVARDIQAEALVRVENAGYPVVMHTHDEACAEVPADPRYNVENMCQIVAQNPAWCDWWPLKAAGWEHTRYQKD
jgi:DNA polymerase